MATRNGGGENLVYAIGPEASKQLKIGTSNNVPVRLGQIQNMSPVKLTVQWTTPGDELLEGALHQRFDVRRTHGEWFDFEDVDDPIAEIDAAAQVESERLATAEANWAPQPGWKPECSIFQFGGAMLVMPSPSEGGWRCTALEGRRRRRCNRMMDDGALYRLESSWAIWIVPGLGTVQGRTFHSDFRKDRALKDNEMLRTLLSQVCRRHEGHHDRLPAAWRTFEYAKDHEFIKRFEPATGDFGLMPGMEYLSETVEDFAWGQVIEPIPFELPQADTGKDVALSDAPVPMGDLTPTREIVKRDMEQQFQRFIDVVFDRRQLGGAEGGNDA